MKRRTKGWSFRHGSHGAAVVVYERGGRLYGRTWDRTLAGGKGGWLRRSLKHADREAAKEWAKQQAGKLSEGTAQLATGRTTLARIFAAYAAAQQLKAV